MPEGDTVHRTARRLEAALVGELLTSTDFRVPALATYDLSGLRITGSLARGKHLLLRIGEEWTLHTHLKMEGSWHLVRPGGRWRRPAHQARVVLHTAHWQAVGFSLGVVDLLRRQDEDDALSYLGPDLLGPDWSSEVALQRLRSNPARAIAPALLDQRNLAGIGNMYAAEALFLCGINPQTPVHAVRDLDRLVSRAQALLKANVVRAVQSTTGSLAPGRRLWVHDRSGQPCRRCGTPVKRQMLGEPQRARATYWCPHCQPPVAG